MRILLIPLIALAWFLQASLLVQGASALAMGGLILLWKQTPAGIGLKTGVLLIGLLLTMAAGSAKADDIYYVHVDHLNTPTVVTDANQQVVWEGAGKPFGETEEIVALINQPFRFPGQYYDVETGLHYNMMRDYDPGIGRYLQSDPIGLGGGVNTYGYAGQNPVMYYDPNGEYAIPLFYGFLKAFVDAFTVAFGFVLVFDEIIDGNNDNVIPFPVADTSTADPDCPDECDLERQSIINNEIAIKSDIQSGPPKFGPNAGNEILWASKIRAKKKAWNNWVSDYNGRCPKKIPRRFLL